MNIIKLIVPLVSVLVVVIPILLIKALNVKKNVRCKQLRFPIISIVFAVICCIFISRIAGYVDKIIDLPFMQKVINWVSPNGKLEFVVLVYTAIVSNAVILFAFLIVKFITKIGVKRKAIPADNEELHGIRKLYWSIVCIFHNVRNSTSFTRRKMVKAEHTLRYAAWIISGLYIIFMLFLQLPVFSSASWIPYRFIDSCVENMYIWPAITLIVLNELRWFMQSKEEFSKPADTEFDNFGLKTNADYSELAEQYESQFPKRFVKHIIGKEKNKNVNFFNDVSAESKLEKAIADQLRERGYTVNRNFISCIGHLSKGENALIDASIFSDFGEYLFLYLNALLSQGDNVLFLCPDEESSENFACFVSDKFRSINNYHRIWIVKSSENNHGASDADILVQTPQMILDNNVFISQENFFSRLRSVIVINTPEILTRSSTSMAVLAHRLTGAINGKQRTQKIQYVCLSESIPPETSNTLKQVLDLDTDLYTCDSYQSFDNTHIILWNYEATRSDIPSDLSDNNKDILAQDNLFGDNISQTFWGVSLPIACVGMKYMVSRISIISHDSAPYAQIVDSMKQQTSRLSGYFNSDIGFDDFDSILRFNIIDREDSHTAFIIVEDDRFNLPLAVYNYCRFGGTDTSMIHIISKSYMLRDYFAYNAQKYVNSESQANMITPAYSDTRQIAITKLLCQLLETGVTQQEFLKRINDIDSSVDSIEKALSFFSDAISTRKIGQNPSLSSIFRFKTVSVFDHNTVDYFYDTIITLKQNAPLEKILSESKLVRLRLRDKYHTIGVFANRIYQTFLPYQNLIYMGRMYRINSIDANEGVINVVEASDRLLSPVDFVQVRKYKLIDTLAPSDYIPVAFKQVNSDVSGEYCITVYEHAHIAVETLGCYSLSPVCPKLDFVSKAISYNDLNTANQKAVYREFSDAKILSLVIKNVGEQVSDRTAFLLAVMMNELMKTIFPYSYNSVAVCPVINDNTAVIRDELCEHIARAYPQIELHSGYMHNANDAEVIIIEDCSADIGAIRSLLLEKHFPFRVFFETISSYLKWFREFKPSGNSNISNKYLYFGSDTPPACFDFETLEKICSKFDTIERIDPILVDKIKSKLECSYCHRNLYNTEFTEVSANGKGTNRILCSQCAKLIVKDEAELQKLYNKAYSYLCSTFGITLPSNINVRFASADHIRKRLKTGDQRVVVGFADPRTRELWVETNAPAANVLDVIAHELTHFWQFDNLKKLDLVYAEGHASYVEVQFMKHENRMMFAQWEEASLNARQDEYGEGFRMMCSAMQARGDGNSFAYMYEMFGQN